MGVKERSRVHSRFILSVCVRLRLKVFIFGLYSRTLASVRGSLNELVSFQLAELLVFVPGVGV